MTILEQIIDSYRSSKEFGLVDGKLSYEGKSSSKEMIKFIKDHTAEILSEAKDKYASAQTPEECAELMEATSAIFKFYFTHSMENHRELEDFYTEHVAQKWMSLLPEQMTKVPLKDLYLPGTHDSAAYKSDWSKLATDTDSRLGRLLKTGSFTSYLFSATVKVLSVCTPVKWVVDKWVKTQEHDLETQLKRGARLLDLRVTYNPIDGKAYLSHTFLCITLEDGLAQINKFCRAHPSEVVVVNMSPDSMFKSYTNTVEGTKVVQDEVNKAFGERLVRTTADNPNPALNYTLDEAKKSGTNVVVVWEGKELIEGVEHLVGASREKWLNSDSFKELDTKLKEEVDKPKLPGQFLAYTLTPDGSSIKREVLDVLKSAGTKVNTMGVVANAQTLNRTYVEKMERHPEQVSKRFSGVIIDSPSSAAVHRSVLENFKRSKSKSDPKTRSC